jgi:hypothetical protein
MLKDMTRWRWGENGDDMDSRSRNAVRLTMTETVRCIVVDLVKEQ